jgi:branched-chain amino acid transport system permease protein
MTDVASERLNIALPFVIGAALIALPFVYTAPYPMHLMIVVLIWSFAYTSWSVMGRFGLVSLGHGGFFGVGAYATALLWNNFHLSPFLGMPVGMAITVVLALLVAYPCSRFRITGHYFALVTLALSAIVQQVATAARGITSGSLGYTPEHVQGGSHILAFQFDDKLTWYFIALGVWACGLFIRWRVDRSMIAYALEAIAEDEDAAGAAGVNVTAEKLKITAVSAAMTALAGGLYCQYQMFISPDTVSGISVSLQMVFAAVVGGIYVLPGPTVGAIITILLTEGLRIFFGTGALGWDNLVYGTLLVLFIIFLPQGLVGAAWNKLTSVRQTDQPAAPRTKPVMPTPLAGER